MLSRVIWANIAPPIRAIVLLTLEFLLHNVKFLAVCKIGGFVAVGLLLCKLGSKRVLDSSQPAGKHMKEHQAIPNEPFAS